MKKLTPLKIVKKLINQYVDINEKVAYINSGGCGVFAEHLYKALLNLGLRPKLVILTNDIAGMNKRVKTGSCSGSAYITHVVVRVGRYFIDSEGLYKKIEEIRRYHGYWTGEVKPAKCNLERLQGWNQDSYAWNHKFDRDHIETIEKKLEDCYKKINENLVVSI